MEICSYENNSDSVHRQRAIVIISTILPAFAACIMATAFKNKVVAVVDTQRQQTSHMQPALPFGAAPPPTYNQVFQQQSGLATSPQQQQSYFIQQLYQHAQQQYQYEQARDQPTQYQPPVYQPFQYQQPQQPQYEQPQPQQPQFQPQYQTQYQRPQPQQPTVTQPLPGARDATETASSIAEEQNAIGRAAVVHCMLMIPYALFRLLYTLNDDRTTDLSEEFILGMRSLGEYLIYARSVLTPIIWFLSIK